MDRVITCKECDRVFVVSKYSNEKKVLAGHNYKHCCNKRHRSIGFNEHNVELNDIEPPPRDFSVPELCQNENEVCGDVSSFSNAAHDIDEFASFQDPHDFFNLSPAFVSDLERTIQSAERLSETIDNFFEGTYAVSGSFDGNEQEAFNRIVQYHGLSQQCVRDLVKFLNQFMKNEGRTSFRFIPSAVSILDSSQPESKLVVGERTKVVNIAIGLRRGLEDGLPIKLVFREPLELISRAAGEILHRFGKEAFRIGHSEFYENAQDGKFLQSVQNDLKCKCDDEFLVVPLRLHADGAHMRANGLHSITPVLLSVAHRFMYSHHDGLKPELATCIPSAVEYFARLKSDFPECEDVKKWIGNSSFQKDLGASLVQGILYHLLVAVRHITSGDLKFYLTFKGQKIRAFVILFKKVMDMPMMSLASVTKNSAPMVQSSPCQQCLAKGKNESYFLSDSRAEYRLEKDVWDFYLSGHIYEISPALKAKGVRLNLKPIGRPLLLRMNPFDERGSFLLTSGDGLHAFKSIWFRGMVNLAMYAIYISSQACSEFQASSDSVAMHNDGVNEGTSFSAAFDTVMECTSDSTVQTDSDEQSNDQASSCDSEDDSRSTESQDEGDSNSEDLEESIEPIEQQSAAEKYEKLGLMKISNVAERISSICRTKKGRNLKRIAEMIVAESRDRKGANYLPCRAKNVLEQASKIQEHKYSLGMLMQMMVLVGSDTTADCMGARFRKLWLAAACRSVLVYSRLYQKEPSDDGLAEASVLIKELLKAVQELKDAMGHKWNAAKIHLLIHFPDMVKEFGRMRIFDTTDGETALKGIKRAYSKISNRDVYENYNMMLLKKLEITAISRLKQVLERHRTKSVGLGEGDLEPSEHRNGISEDLRNQLTGASKRRRKFVVFVYRRAACSGVCQERIQFHNLAMAKAKVTPMDFPLWYAEERAEAWKWIQGALCEYLDGNASRRHSNYIVELDFRPTARLQNSDVVCASNRYYGKPRYDFVAFRAKCTNQYGRLILLAKITIFTIENSIMCERAVEDVVFINALQKHETLDELELCSACCKDFQGVLIHGRVKRCPLDGSRHVQCIALDDLIERISVLSDAKSLGLTQNRTQGALAHSAIHEAYPGGDWYYLVSPDTFRGVDTYN